MSIQEAISDGLARRGISGTEAERLTPFLLQRFTDGERWLDGAPGFNDALAEIRDLGTLIATNEERTRSTITVAEYNADPARYAARLGRGELTVVDNPPGSEEPEIVKGANGQTLPRDEFDQLPLRQQAAFCIGEN